RNGRSLVLRVNDRGPYAHDRIIDLSRRSAHALGFVRDGTARVRVQYMGHAPLNGDDSLERRVYASQPWARMASLSRSGKQGAKRNRRTQLAQARQKEPRADPMVVGSIPDAGDSSAKAWATHSKTAAAPPIPSDMRAFTIQAASFRNKDFADTMRSRLANLGSAYVQPANIAGKTYYRVRLGPYDKRHDADEALRAVVGSGVSDARIMRN
ncbi:MAG: SPOR domain-containing protein, partial [Methyloligellaceae bacterium]